MIDKAIAKITEEMMKIKGAPPVKKFAQMIEEHLTNICTTEAVANKLLDPNKSLAEFVDKIVEAAREEARKGGSGWQMGGDTDEIQRIEAEDYYGITEADKASVVATPAEDIIDISDFL